MKTLYLTALLVAAGCAGGAADNLGRDFQNPASEVWEASVKSMGSMNLCLSSESDDQVGGDLVATGARGQEVRLRIRSLDAHRSRVSVRVEPDDPRLANQLQERIAENLARSAQGTYETDLGVAMLMARRPSDRSTSASWSTSRTPTGRGSTAGRRTLCR